MNLIQQYDVQHSLFSIDQLRVFIVFKKRRRQSIAIKSNNIIITSIVIKQNTTIETRRFVSRYDLSRKNIFVTIGVNNNDRWQRFMYDNQLPIKFFFHFLSLCHGSGSGRGKA